MSAAIAGPGWWSMSVLGSVKIKIVNYMSHYTNINATMDADSVFEQRFAKYFMLQ